MTTQDDKSTDAPAAVRNKARLLLTRMLKVGVVLLVIWALGRHLRALIAEWARHEMSLRGLYEHLGWIGVAMAAFLAGQLCFSMFWGRLLRRSGLIVSPMATLTAYSVGTLGKYVPGKALVVLLRTWLLPDGAISRLSVGLTVAYETLTMMAVGGAVAGVCLFIVHPRQWLFWSASAAGACGLATCLHPALFGRLARFASLPLRGAGDDFPAKACWATFWRCGVLAVAGWGLLGVSFWGTAQAMGVACSTVDEFLFLTGTAAMATAAGFLVLFMPAGLGVRELVIIQLLAPRYGLSEAVLASLLLRTLWTLNEALLAAALWSARTLPSGLHRTAMHGAKPESPVAHDASRRLIVLKAKPGKTLTVGAAPTGPGADVQPPTGPVAKQHPVEDTARC